MTQVDLFGNPIVEAAPPAAPYREVGMLDTASPACGECQHVHRSRTRDGYDTLRDWVCKLTRKPVDPDDGTCGRWERRQG